MIKRSYDECHLIDGTQMLVPDVDIEITYDDIEGADRGFDQAGYYHRTVVRFNKRSWKFKYSVLTKEEFVYLRSLVKEKQDFLFSFITEKNEEESVRAYCKPVSVAYYSKRSGLYRNLTLEIIEC